MDFALPQANITAETPIHLGPAVFRMLTSPRLLDAVEWLVGPEIECNPHPPHPDQGAPAGGAGGALELPHRGDGLAPGPRRGPPGAGRLPRAHRLAPGDRGHGAERLPAGDPPLPHRDLAHHCLVSPAKKGLHIPDSFLAPGEPVALPMCPGDVLLMHKKTMHASLANESDDIRWSMDLRYNPTGEASGRPAFPSFVARSRAHPEQELHDPQRWAAPVAGDAPAPGRAAGGGVAPFNRWSRDPSLCA